MEAHLINITEVCRRLGISKQIFYRMRRAGSVPLPMAGSKLYSWPLMAAAVGLPPEWSEPVSRKGVRP
jgi:predicted DNA-binding transcriptional regulator AlpA